MDRLLHGSRLTKNPLQCKGFVCVGLLLLLRNSL
jgi:hypothetical protein